ncbi:methylenetetrahydrofolate--tRNA-(uracil(54)-C(5))-methyltransferase (FADH(2)-oxidizing) TrmFO, partial [Myxococcota bacterium]|nr:methylenetetrahydrofolate--tRNA-(uracil(54)-C(5))-methyltransferase (FADH(2)-oxidizing) TrmFO [Myxococcota bacterium]
ELVCSNSLKSDDTARPAGQLKNELLTLGSLLMEAASLTRVPAGCALAVDRDQFAAHVQSRLESHPNITFIRKEITEIPQQNAIIATGPLTSPALFSVLQEKIGDNGYFYDAIAPVVETDSIDFSNAYYGNRWGKGDDPMAYINCPLDREQFEALVVAIRESAKVPLRSFEDPKYFESCLPVEVMAERGMDVLRYGPLRPIGLRHPETGEKPWAVLQLRTENSHRSSYNLVGFQTRMTYPEQDRVIKLIPALREAVILRHGEMHRNSFFNAPVALEGGMKIPGLRSVYLSGLLLGVEGYVESIAAGLLTAMYLLADLSGTTLPALPQTTCMGGLQSHISIPSGQYSPTNVHFGLWPRIDGKMPKKHRHEALIKRSQQDFTAWYNTLPPLFQVQ